MRAQESGRTLRKALICRKKDWKEVHTKMVSEAVLGDVNVDKFPFSLLCIFCSVVMILL